MQIGLVPLDERPVNTRYPAMIAAIAGAAVQLPPPELLGSFRRPADCAALGEWLEQAAGELDGLVVSCEMLGYGGLIASRISHDTAADVLGRLDVLRAIRRARPGLPLLGFNLVTRISKHNSGDEEPPYWPAHGPQLFGLSELLDRLQHGHAVDQELAQLRASIPPDVQQDFVCRRARNHAVNLAVLGMLAEGVLDLLVLSSDDTSPYGLPSREKRSLAAWAELLGLGERLLMYPGADEVGSALVARLINRRAGLAPRFEVQYAPPEAAANVAAYEDGPVRLTVERQVRAVGGQVAESEADCFLAVNAPVARRSEWHPAFAAHERDERQAALAALVEQLRQRQQRGEPVAVADVAYPNGSDPALTELLFDRIDLTALAAYGGWNTAGNTIGTVLAQASASLQLNGAAGRLAAERFLVHRLVEDWGYQQLVRQEAHSRLASEYGAERPDAATMEQVCRWIEARLAAVLDELPGFGGRWRIVAGSVRLPWGRLFEVDFDLAPSSGAAGQEAV